MTKPEYTNLDTTPKTIKFTRRYSPYPNEADYSCAILFKDHKHNYQRVDGWGVSPKDAYRVADSRRRFFLLPEHTKAYSGKQVYVMSKRVCLQDRSKEDRALLGEKWHLK